MDWGKSYSASWRVFKVNTDTWADGELIRNIDSANITKDADSKLLESGTFEVSGELEKGYYRIVMTAEQGGSIERVDVATLMFIIGNGKIDYSTKINNAEGYSVLYPASMTAVPTGEFAPAGADGAAYAGSLLARAINAPIKVEGSFTLNENIVFDISSTVLEAVWAVLDAGGFVIQIDGKGVVHILPIPTEPSLVISGESVRLLFDGIEFTEDEGAIPNRYIVIQNEKVTIATNDDPTSPVSTVSKGYIVDEVDSSPAPVNGETLNGYALRKLKESSILKSTRRYAREYSPDVYPYSVIKSSVDGMEGDYRVCTQSLACGAGITVTEKVAKEVILWE